MPTALAEAASHHPDARAGSSCAPASPRVNTTSCTRASCLPARAPVDDNARAPLPTSAATRALQRLLDERVIAALTNPAARAHDWPRRAACATDTARASLNLRAFFAGDNARATQAALALCARCAVRADCLIESLRTSSTGTWAGMTHTARKAYARRIQPRVDARLAGRSRTTP